MAQVANCAEKHVDLSGVQSSEDMTIVDDDDSPSSSKKLKQARLPFKPIGPKSQICVNPAPHGVPKKRKLSDQESPSAKAPKIFSKHQADRLKHDIPEKTQSDVVDHDNEVSSSSEAENVPVSGMPKRKACETNILERFIRKSSQEEISSTNEVVDLTEISEEIVDNSDNANASLEVTSSKGVKKARNKLTSNEQAQLDENGAGVKPENINNGFARKDKDEAEKEISISESECKGEGNKAEDTSVAELGPIMCVDVDMVEEKDAPTSQDKEEVTQIDTAKVDDLDASVISGQSDENKSLELNASSSSKSDSDEESSTSSDESDEDVNDSLANTSLNGTQNSCGDVSINDSLADKSGSSLDKSPTVNTSTCKTPKTKAQKAGVSTTPGGSTVQTSTPKNLRERPASIKMSEIKKLERKQEQEVKRQKIREQKERERQQQKEKKEQEKLEAKKKRDEEKAEKERKKKEEKDKKERERQEKKDQLEREKQEKLQQKEDEKKKKQDIIDAKMEEKRKKDEEKQREEDEKNKKKQKEKQTFTSFFIKKAQSQAPSKVKEQSHFFMPFEVKKDMFLAPRTRRELEEDDKAALDQHLQTQKDQPLYIKEITNSSYQKKHSSRTLPRLAVSPPNDVDDEDSVKCMDTVEEKNKNLVRHHCKLLQFHTNYRPPYYGTWRKMSQVLNPRKPFKQDMELFDYEVDSDDEWEEEEPGESVSSSEDEGDEKEDKDEDEEEEEDGWMVPHGYLSEDEGCEQDEEITPDVLKARQMAKQEAWEAEQKRQKQPVRAVVIGLAWEGEAIAANLAAKLAQFQAVCLSMVPIDTKSRPADGTGGGKDGDRTSFGKGNRKPVPEEAMPDLIRLLHGNLIGIKKLIKEFRLYWKKKTSGSLGEADDDNMDVDESVTDKNASVLESSCTDEKNAQVSAVDISSGGVEGDGSKDTPDGWGMSKRQLEMKIMSIAVRERRPNFKKVCWYVKEEVLKQYKMEELVLPNAWQYVSKGLIKVKNEEAAGRKTPNNLSESFTDSVSVIMKEEPAAEDAEAKPLPKDQPSIMQFAKKMQPSELPKPKIRRVQLKPASPVPTPSAERSPVTDLDLSAGEEVLGPYKTLPKDQRSIMDFAKKPQNGARTVPPNIVKNMLLSPKSSSADLNTSPKQILSKETTPKRKISKETRETTPKQKMSRETTPKQTVSRETTPKQTVSRETTPKQTVSRETTLKEETVSLKVIAPTPSVTAVPTMNNVVAKKNVISASKEEAMDVDDCIIID